MSLNKLLPLCPIEVMCASFVSKPFPASNHADEFSKLNENLRQLNEKLDKDDTILRQRNEVPPEQNETTQVLSANETNFGKRSFILLNPFSREKNNPSGRGNKWNVQRQLGNVEK